MIPFLVIGFALLALVDVPELVREKLWKELIVYSVILAAALAMAILDSFDFVVLNPAELSQYLVKDFFSFLHLTYD